MDPSQVSAAFGGGLAGLLAVIVVALAGLLWAVQNSRLKDCKTDHAELKQEKRDLLAQIGPLTSAVERQTATIETMQREMERRQRGTR